MEKIAALDIPQLKSADLSLGNQHTKQERRTERAWNEQERRNGKSSKGAMGTASKGGMGTAPKDQRGNANSTKAMKLAGMQTAQKEEWKRVNGDWASTQGKCTERIQTRSNAQQGKAWMA